MQSIRLSLGAALVAAFATTSVAASRWHDPKMDQADAAAEKALVLLSSAACGVPDEKSTKECEKLLGKAVEALARSREDIAAAAAAADGIAPLAKP